MKAALALWLRLAAASLVVSALTDAALMGFAPRWLLLDQSTLAATAPLARSCMLVAALAELVAIAALLLPARAVLRELRAEESWSGPAPVLALYALPARLTAARVGIGACVGAATLIEGVRPSGVDVATHGALALLALTLMATASLPLYVMARSRVAKVLERAPSTAAKEALDALRAGDDRVRWRFLAAVAAPVSLVAVGAMLLVFAHERSYDASARDDDARAVAAGTLDLVDGHEEGRAEVLLRATQLGLHAEIEPEDQPVPYDPESRAVTAPLEDGRAIVRLEPVALSSATVSWGLLVLVAVATAALLGRRLGAVLSRDVALAREDLDAMGVDDVMRGAPLIAGARFDSVRALGDAIGKLGGVFREFAAAQERAIIARASMERTRAMFLASMSHDLRGPLNAILGFAALASQDAALLPPQRESLAIIERRGRELLALIQTVLDSARAEAGQLSIVRELISPTEVVEQAARDASSILEGSGVELVARLGPKLPRASLDATRLSQAIVAIVTSIARASERGELRLGVTADDSALRVEIEGRGGVEAAASRVAEALQSPERARRLGSLGLGLLLARAIVALHGGELALVPDPTRIVVRVTVALRDGSRP